MAKVVLSSDLISAIHQVWQSIGDELVMCCEEAGEPLTNEGAIESVIDADRMSSFLGAKGKAADAEIAGLIKQHTYAVVMRELNKQIRLN